MANTLLAGLEIISEEAIDLVLLDLGLPDSQGLDSYIDVQRADLRLPVIVMTSSMPDLEDGQKAVALGAQDYIGKDEFTPQLLSRIIPYAISRKQILLDLQRSQRLAKMGNWQISLGTNQWSASHALYELLELDPFTESFDDYRVYISHILAAEQGKVEQAFLDAAEYGRSFRIEHRFVNKHGEIRHFSIQGEVVPTTARKTGQIIGTVQDITDLKKIESLEEEKALAEKEARIRQEFLAKTSHEIRTPLNPILVLTRLLLDGDLPETHRHQVETIRSAAKTLLALVNDILDISKIEAGKVDFSREPFMLGEVLESVMDMMVPNALQKGVQLEAKWEDDIPEILVGDKVRLLQILLNLVGNGIKFTEEGAVSIQAKAEFDASGHLRVLFSVMDTGIGIPQDKQREIFEGFKRLKTSLGHRAPGTGLGLTIVKQLVRMQGGEIGVESVEGEGSVFTFWLPFGMIEASGRSVNGHDRIPQSGDLHGQISSKKEVDGLRILLVEDDPLNQMVTCNLLETWKIQVAVANNGREAIELLEHKSFDVVLMDMQMPIMDGLDATRYIRSELADDVQDIPIIALTANATPDSETQCLEAGMNDYLSKPIEIDNLYRKIVSYRPRKHKRKSEDPDLIAPIVMNQPTEALDQSRFLENDPPDEGSITTGENQSQSMSEIQYTDLSYIREITGNDAGMIRKTINKFLDNTPAMVSTMQSNLENEAYLELQRIVHKMKSSVEFMGIVAIKTDIQKVLDITRTAQTEAYPELSAYVNRISDVLDVAYGELREERDNL